MYDIDFFLDVNKQSVYMNVFPLNSDFDQDSMVVVVFPADENVQLLTQAVLVEIGRAS
ncbi:hypothetical protein VAL01S_01_02030 [Vibrio alginolyticus NBRC 15630 = ATCC 17749]|jgi:hypothetical protein|uniref:Uncharacterized protein n=1 Tax=Vibrio alginolyticus (strain ATCC 17749 / DSM 2171 / NBRC 15630 / NCIMB 1903 / NCTC 12160 / XII-53) TaxID=1219076 RepID=A0A2I3CQ38_VIBAX|nr:hypothetical protein N646_4077 [Vibrio alginolyticus NBRC 15630 = ATCC 17749]EGQ8156444.1 hypothetical protein [Vibrio alginolyticus]BCG14983.1 hypothetical protein YZOS03_34660 [Vibrio alginolyticus]BCG20569.1 hypothetical protein HLBS07_44210 [Vibrio alginolyticus]GAD69778.1 hypothetical protein VAL01S_01_02030 [Vibrio alginolyticus NBRC 15630 = ATCC 17749]